MNTVRYHHMSFFHRDSNISFSRKNIKEYLDMYQLPVYNSKQDITSGLKWQTNENIFSEKIRNNTFELSLYVT